MLSCTARGKPSGQNLYQDRRRRNYGADRRKARLEGFTYTEAGGSLDELNALLGVARSLQLPDGVDKTLQLVQDDLFQIGAELATPEGTNPRSLGISDEEIRRLESEIDAIESGLEPLKQFILPGGSTAGAGLHLARAVARRTERHCVTLSRIERIEPQDSSISEPAFRSLFRPCPLCQPAAIDAGTHTLESRESRVIIRG